MKLYAPKYYSEFSCIADKCKHSCCVGWEIDVDEVAMKKYSSLSGKYSDEIRASISNEDQPHFILCTHDRCPHLNEKGLCQIILNVGEEYLCDICREHPRFYNYTPKSKEVGLGLSCEEAARIILSSDDYSELVTLFDVDENEAPDDFDATILRTHVFEILSNRKIDYRERLNKIRNEFEISLSVNSDDEWRNILSKLEYLDQSHRDIFTHFSSTNSRPIGIEKYCERLFAYFVYRHTTESFDEIEFAANIGFALFCEQLFVFLLNAGNKLDFSSAIECARIISEEIEYSTDNTDAIRNAFLR